MGRRLSFSCFLWVLWGCGEDEGKGNWWNGTCRSVLSGSSDACAHGRILLFVVVWIMLSRILRSEKKTTWVLADPFRVK